MPRACNVDLVALPGVDVVMDVDHGPWQIGPRWDDMDEAVAPHHRPWYPGAATDKRPWPWDDCTFDRVIATHVFEHVADPIRFVRESCRVLRAGGTLVVTVPHYQSRNAFTDPTHRRFCTEQTFDYWVPGTALHREMGAQYAGPFTFRHQHVNRNGGDLIVTLHR